MAFLEIAPVARAHLVIALRAHATGLGDLDPQDAGWMMMVNLWLVDDATTGHEVFHSYLHVVSRTADNGFTTTTAFQVSCREALDKIAAQVRTVL